MCARDREHKSDGVSYKNEFTPFIIFCWTKSGQKHIVYTTCIKLQLKVVPCFRILLKCNNCHRIRKTDYFKVSYLARMGRAAKDGVKLPTEDMNLVVLRRAIAAAAAAVG